MPVARGARSSERWMAVPAGRSRRRRLWLTPREAALLRAALLILLVTGLVGVVLPELMALAGAPYR